MIRVIGKDVFVALADSEGPDKPVHPHSTFTAYKIIRPRHATTWLRAYADSLIRIFTAR